MIRTFESNQDYGDAYTWVATCRFVNKETVEILGVIKAPTKTEWLAVINNLAQMGVKFVFYKQYRNGRIQIRRRRTYLNR